MNKKIATFVIAMVLLLGITMGATFALLSDKTGSVTNTFVAGGFGDLTLEENNAEITTNTTNQYTVVPGKNITKDPKVSFDYTATDNNVDAYVFVKMEYGSAWTQSNDYMTFSANAGSSASDMSFNIGSDWTLLEISDPTSQVVVYYKTISSDISGVSIIDEDTITVSEDIKTVTLTTPANYNLTFSAYAIQKEGIEKGTYGSVEEAAWIAVSEQTNG